MSWSTGRDQAAVDLSEMPIFEMQPQPLASLVRTVLPDLGLLASLVLLPFAVAFVGFLRQDVVG